MYGKGATLASTGLLGLSAMDTTGQMTLLVFVLIALGGLVIWVASILRRRANRSLTR